MKLAIQLLHIFPEIFYLPLSFNMVRIKSQHFLYILLLYGMIGAKSINIRGFRCNSPQINSDVLVFLRFTYFQFHEISDVGLYFYFSFVTYLR